MPNPYPAIWQFLDSLGTRLDGEVTFTDPANQPGGGGGGSVNSVTAGDSSITIGGTLADPTVAVAALGVTQAKIADGAVTDVQVNAANKDGLAAVASMRTLGTGALQATAGNDPRLSDARTPTGAAGGDLTGTYPNPTLAAFGGGAAGPVGSATVVPIVTVDAKGRVSALSSATISGVAPGGAAGGDLSGTYPNPTTAKLNGVAITNAPVLGQVLTATDATHAQWAAAGGSSAFSGARVWRSTNQLIANNTLTAVSFDSERFDTDGYHEAVINPTRLTIPTSGKYLIGFTGRWAGNGSGWRSLRIRVNGTTDIVEVAEDANGTDDRNYSMATLWDFTAGDYAEVYAFQLSGGNLNLLALAARAHEFWIVMLG